MMTAWDRWGYGYQNGRGIYRLQRTTPPAGVICDFDTICAHLRLGDPTSEEALARKPLLDRLAKAVDAEIERYCDIALLEQSWTMTTHRLAPLWGHWGWYYEGQPAFRMPKPPLKTMTDITVDGALVDAATYGIAIDERLPALLYGKPTLPTPASIYPDSVRLRFICGRALAEVPADIVNAALMIIALWYENPESAVPCHLEELPSFGGMSALDRYRVPVFA